MKRQQTHVKDILKPKGAPSAAASATDAIMPPHRAPGRPPRPDASSKITVVLYDRQTQKLDDLCYEIYDKSRSRTVRTKITRTELIRGVLDAVLSSGIDLTGVVDESAVRDLVSARLKKS